MKSLFLIVVMVLSGVMCASAQISDSAQLQQLIAELQTKPDDRGLRERIIKLASEMKPSPPIPRKAKEHEDAAQYIVGTAKTEADFALAAGKFEEALRIAPWSDTYYHNAALMYEKAKQLEKALVNYELYLLAAPNASDADVVTRKVEALKFAAKLGNDRDREAKLWNGPWIMYDGVSAASPVVAKDMGDRIEFYHKRNLEMGEKQPFLVGAYRRQNGSIVWGSWTFLSVATGCGNYSVEVKADPDLRRYDLTLKVCNFHTKSWTTERVRYTIASNRN